MDLGCSGSSMGKSPELVHQCLGFEPGEVREVCWMPLRSEAVLRVLQHGFHPPLNPVESRERHVPYALTLTILNPETWRTRPE